MFQFPAFAFLSEYHKSGGFPHSEILGSQFICKLTGAYRML